MANIKLSRKIFEKEIGKLGEKMQDKIAMFGTPIESLDNETIELEIFPDRPDLLSYHGYKRAFLAFLGKKTGLKQYKIHKPEKDYHVVIDSSVREVRPFTACAIIKKLRLDDEKIKEIIDMQEKLHSTLGRKRKKIAIGIYPLEKIKLPITLKALEPDKIQFIPLGCTEEMSGLKILQRHPTGREYAHLLAGKAKFPIFVDAKNDILSMPPIINSQLTGKVEKKTKEVFIECSGFDFEILKKCLNILVAALADMGGQIYAMELHYPKIFRKKKEVTPNLSPINGRLNINNAEKLLGIKLTEKSVKNFLGRMGHKYQGGAVLSPAWRTDLLHEVDIIEDIAIAYGYENFAPKVPEISSIGEERKEEIAKRKISEILSGLKMLEVSNYHLTTKKDQEKTLPQRIPKQKNEFIEVENSKTEYSVLRKDLSHYLLKNLSENIDAEYPQQIFEIGKIFDGSEEKTHLSIAISPGNFTQLKQTAEYLFRMLNQKYEIHNTEESPPHLIDGRTGKIKINGKTTGFMGEVHPRVLRKCRIKMPVAILEIDLKEVFNK